MSKKFSHVFDKLNLPSELGAGLSAAEVEGISYFSGEKIVETFSRL
ncbi:MAG: hypothetical protein LBE35_11230 [Clostridiales bacterium]|jgi:hypothetical protein|nr:hypothetical protein [Clostridiales bacterium]